MSNDLLPMLDILAGPPKDAGPEDRVVAAANGSGGSVRRHDISLDLRQQMNGAATTVHARDPMTDHDAPLPVSTALADGLTGVAMTIRQIESVLNANGALAPEVHFAIERIQDVAMALRMREVDAALCDTLEASSREVGDAIVRNDAAAARTLGAAALLRDLGKRIDQMMRSAPLGAIKPDKVDEAPSVAVSGEHVAQANGAAPRPMAAQFGVAVPEDDHPRSLPQPAFVHPRLPEMRLSGEAKQEPARSPRPVVLSMPSPVDEDEDAAANDRPADEPATNPDAETAAEPIPVETAAIAVPHDEPVVEPDEQTVEPATLSASAVAETNEAAPANSRASANDPLAALHGLSEEELIALFS